MMLRSVQFYVRELRPLLSADAFAPARSRLVWLPVHALFIAAAIALLASRRVNLPVACLLSLGIGASFAGLTFVAHETLHGGIVRGRRLRHAVGFVCFVPFVL